MTRDRDDRLFAVGAALWVAVIVATWPRALSFGDEVGYVSRARLLLAGQLHYVAGTCGVWIPTPHGLVGKFPLLPSVLLAPLAALTPRAVFALPVAAALLLAATARAALKSWGRSPLWALLVLAHPTVVILSRTAMADVPQAAAAVAGWWACRRGRTAATVVWLALLVALKATGNVLALAIVAGEGLSSLPALRARDGAAWRRLMAGAAGGALGLGLSLAQNRLANGTFASGYDAVFEQIRPFSLSYLPARAPTHLATLLLEPPLLAAGAWTFWRRRDFGPLLVVGGFLAMMCVYFFDDTGASALETAVLSGRLILPVIAFLLVGYGAWLSDLVARLRQAPAWLGLAVVAICLGCTAAVSVRHWRYQRSMLVVREAASAVADAAGDHVLGVTASACKEGLMHDGPTVLFAPAGKRPAAVFCSEHTASHRAPQDLGTCAFPGYHAVSSWDGFVALARDDAQGGGR
jgi:hypothetical protein